MTGDRAWIRLGLALTLATLIGAAVVAIGSIDDIRENSGGWGQPSASPVHDGARP